MRTPATEETLSMPPWPRLRMPGSTACVSRARASTLSLICASAPSAGTSANDPDRPKPALLTSSSTGLLASDRRFSAASRPAGVIRSAASTSTCTWCAARRPAASSSSRPARRATSMRSQPSAASSLASRSPMPLDAPVTSAVRYVWCITGLVSGHQLAERLSRVRVLLRMRDQRPGKLFRPGAHRNGLARQHHAADLAADLGHRGATLDAERHDALAHPDGDLRDLAGAASPPVGYSPPFPVDRDPSGWQRSTERLGQDTGVDGDVGAVRAERGGDYVKREAVARIGHSGTILCCGTAPGGGTDRLSLSSPVSGWQHSSPGEPGLPWPILDETAHPCPLVLGGEQPGEVQPLDLEPGVEIYVKSLVDGLLRGAQRDGGAAGIAVHHLPRRLVHLRVRDDLVHEADGERLRRGHEPPGVDDVLGPGGPDQPRQPLGAACPRDDSQQDLRLAGPGAVAGHPEVGAQRELEAAAERISGDGRHDRLGDLRDRGERVLQPPGVGGHRGVARLPPLLY